MRPGAEPGTLERLTVRTIREEQEAFDTRLPGLLEQHRGQAVLFKDGSVVEYFPDTRAAYAAGISKYGPDQVFLVAVVERPVVSSVSLAWDAGVMFGQ